MDLDKLVLVVAMSVFAGLVWGLLHMVINTASNNRTFAGRRISWLWSGLIAAVYCLFYTAISNLYLPYAILLTAIFVVDGLLSVPNWFGIYNKKENNKDEH